MTTSNSAISVFATNAVGGKALKLPDPADAIENLTPFSSGNSRLFPTALNVQARAAFALGGSTTINEGGVTFKLNYDKAAMASSATGFRAGIEEAAKILSRALSDNILVSLNITYKGTGDHAESLAYPTHGIAYFNIRSALQSNASIGDSIFSALPQTLGSDPALSTVTLYGAQEKALGYLDAQNAAIDGEATFSTDLHNVVAAGLHEITHIMGRVPAGPRPNIFDLFRFSNQTKTRLYDGNTQNSVPAYFSIDNGVTALADFGRTGDPSDFLNGGKQDKILRGASDSFDENWDETSLLALSEVDLQMMRALGFHTKPTPPAFVTNDFNGDDRSDILLRNASGAVEIISKDAKNVYSTSKLGSLKPTWQIVATGDFNSDGKDDIMWKNNTGVIKVWSLKGLTGYSEKRIGQIALDWQIAGTGDFDGDGKADVLRFNGKSGEIGGWYGNGSNSFTYRKIGTLTGTQKIGGVGDLDGDGKADVVLGDADGAVGYLSSKASKKFSYLSLPSSSAGSKVAGVGDFNGDGKLDVLVSDAASGNVSYLASSDSGAFTSTYVSSFAKNQQIAGIGNYFGDHYSDFLMTSSSSTQVVGYDLHAAPGNSHFQFPPDPGSGWQVAKT